jgi:hypothetical protein
MIVTVSYQIEEYREFYRHKHLIQVGVKTRRAIHSGMALVL